MAIQRGHDMGTSVRTIILCVIHLSLVAIRCEGLLHQRAQNSKRLAFSVHHTAEDRIQQPWRLPLQAQSQSQPRSQCRDRLPIRRRPGLATMYLSAKGRATSDTARDDDAADDPKGDGRDADNTKKDDGAQTKNRNNNNSNNSKRNRRRNNNGDRDGGRSKSANVNTDANSNADARTSTNHNEEDRAGPEMQGGAAGNRDEKPLISKDRAISALSRPKVADRKSRGPKINDDSKSADRGGSNGGRTEREANDTNNTNGGSSRNNRHNRGSSKRMQQPKNAQATSMGGNGSTGGTNSFSNKSRNGEAGMSTPTNADEQPSFLPPPMEGESSDATASSASSIDSGLSSWEDFLSSGTGDQNKSNVNHSDASNGKRNGGQSQPSSPPASSSRSQSTKSGNNNIDHNDRRNSNSNHTSNGKGIANADTNKSANTSPSRSNQHAQRQNTSNKNHPRAAASSQTQGLSNYAKSHPKSTSEKLPSITDLFPPDLSSSIKGLGSDKSNTNDDGNGTKNPERSTQSRASNLSDVLPVSELFYRSAKSNAHNIAGGADAAANVTANNDDVRRSLDFQGEDLVDDGEFPFSTEQSSAIGTNHNNNENKIHRSRIEKMATPSATTTKTASKQSRKKQASDENKGSSGSSGSGNDNRPRKTKPGARKMIRRGMDMLVGGVPINADPPIRYMDLYYSHFQNKSPESTNNWHDVISTSSRGFGPMLHRSGQNKLSKFEMGLYCEFFVDATRKWNICPDDLSAMVDDHSAQAFNEIVPASNPVASAIQRELEEELFLENVVDQIIEEVNIDNAFDTDAPKSGGLDGGDSDQSATVYLEQSTVVNRADQSASESDAAAAAVSGPNSLTDFEIGTITSQTSLDGGNAAPGSDRTTNRNSGETDAGAQDDSEVVGDEPVHLGGGLVFTINVLRMELLQDKDGNEESTILQSVVSRAIVAASNLKGYDVEFTRFTLTEMEDGFTRVEGDFTLQSQADLVAAEAERKARRINRALANAMDDGDMQMALAASARQEDRWPESVRERVTEEFLFEDDDPEDVGMSDVRPGGGQAMEASQPSESANSNGARNDIRGVSTEVGEEEDMFGLLQGRLSSNIDDPLQGDTGSGAENRGAVWDISEANKDGAPFQGSLGLRLVDAVTERAKGRHPRVIAIGDVHGCIDELQDLLRECDYRPGDLVIFLGDLVSKGPDSISVVQMAREIGAIGVRGNHDFEVIRWQQAIKSGVDPPVFRSEHFHIASCLSSADMEWMYNLPWYISSQDLGALFVHAGFVSGIRLAKQNPRLMMNMRSILPDGTVTSKFFNNWPWARLWDGPQTVLFGHDADRGLQQYEHAIGLDTGCVYGGRLTACILPEKRLVSVGARREYFKYRRKHYE